MNSDVLCVILGGGQGRRLYPLTKDRAKPAVPLFGKYRLVDIPISNCINSGFNRIKILTQFNSESLNKHISRTYKFDQFSMGFIEIIAADQRMDNEGWFEGPADAVRKSLRHFSNPKIKHICVLSGDQLYKMNLRTFYDYHVQKDAEITVACNLTEAQDISSLGIAGIDKNFRIKEFVEKPKDSDAVKNLAVSKAGDKKFLCSMGIYFFKREVLYDILTRSKKADFGKEVIPEAIQEKLAYAYEFNGYWRDIGTIKSFYKENLALTEPVPPLDLFDEGWPIYTRSRSLPPASYACSRIENSMIADGTVIDSADIKKSIIGLRSKIGKGSKIENSVLMGADYYETPEEINENKAKVRIPLGVGNNCVIKGAILDKNVRIADNVQIINHKKVAEEEGENYLIRDGIVIINKNATIPSGTVI